MLHLNTKYLFQIQNEFAHQALDSCFFWDDFLVFFSHISKQQSITAPGETEAKARFYKACETLNWVNKNGQDQSQKNFKQGIWNPNFLFLS